MTTPMDSAMPEVLFARVKLAAAREQQKNSLPGESCGV
jgi:hypothetical protein